MRFLLLAAPLFLAAASPPYFPPNTGEWAQAEAPPAGLDRARLDAAIEFAGQRRSSAVVILHGGRILAERNWDPERLPRSPQYRHGRAAGGATSEDVASVQKSVMSLLVGIAREKGLLRLDDAVERHLRQGWTKAPRETEQKITVRHLLTMTSGLTDSLEWQAAPGTRWRYNSPAYQQLARVIEKASGQSINDLTRAWLTGRIGMRESHWEDRPGTGGMIGFRSTARELARLGLLVAAGGMWRGEQIVPAAYLREALSSSQALNPSYGYLWWLNGKPVARDNGTRAATLIPAAPADTVAALGALGRKIYVAQSLDLVITRTGQNAQERGETSFDEEFWRILRP